jgi:hypothetical protein
MQKATISFWQCQRAIGHIGAETEGCVLDIHFGGETYILTYTALLWWKKASQISVNRKTAHLQRLPACNTSNFSSEDHTDVAISWYLY